MLQQNRETLIEVCQILAEQEELKATVRVSAVSALYIGAASFVGGLLAGPVGIAVGGTVTSVAVAANAKGQFRSVVDILRNDLNEPQKRKLTAAISKLVNDIKAEDVMTLVALIASRSSLKQALILEIAKFLQQELNLKMIS